MRYYTQEDKPAFIRAKTRPITAAEKDAVNRDVVTDREGDPIAWFTKSELEQLDRAIAEHESLHCQKFKGSHDLLLHDSNGNLWDISLKKEALDDPWYVNGSVPDDAQILFESRENSKTGEVLYRPKSVCYTRTIGQTVIHVCLGVADAWMLPRGRIIQKHPGARVAPAYPAIEKRPDYSWKTDHTPAEIDRLARLKEQLAPKSPDVLGPAGNDDELRFMESRPQTGRKFPRRGGTNQKTLEIVKR